MANGKPDFKETTALQKFRSGIEYIQQHLQLMDASLNKTSQILLSHRPNSIDISVVIGTDQIKHDKLNHPVKSAGRLIN
ncbi:MAG: hypothetical protein GX303_00840, partial [Clostridiales bacterium]|nr:hypothetical protein [Clostridiales bacterium]